MSLKYAVVGSGSKANSYVFECGDFAFVIDNGFPLKEFKKRLNILGFDLAKIKAIFLTHNHGDHIKGLEALALDRGVPVYHHPSTKLTGFIRDRRVQGIAAAPGKSATLGPLDFYPFPLHHDAPHAQSYHFKIGGVRFTLVTDTGRTDELMLKLALRSEVLFLEANYCPVLLKNGPYPPVLQQRVASDLGHLSNQQAVDFLNLLHGNAESRLRQVYFVHLSENNNTVQALQDHLDRELRWPHHYRICARGELVEGRSTILEFQTKS